MTAGQGRELPDGASTLYPLRAGQPHRQLLRGSEQGTTVTATAWAAQMGLQRCDVDGAGLWDCLLRGEIQKS